jgi:5,10-methylenetetrahydrofolate reductase
LEDCEKDEDKIIVLGGDLTQGGKEESYLKANELIKKLKELGMTIILTPG